MAHEDIGWLLGALRERREQYALYRSYYEGDHRLLFATDKFRNAFGALFQAFADNLCPVVVDSLADRLIVEAVQSVGGEEQEADPLAEAAQALWDTNRMTRRAGEVHVEALRSGDAYALVLPDSLGRVRIWPHSPLTMAAQYDEGGADPDVLSVAGKWWVARDGRHRVVLYYPDRIERYVTRTVPKSGADVKAEHYVPYEEDGAPAEEVHPWGQVPVFHFANNAPLGERGRSELADVLPLQDALNKSVCDMLVAMEFHAYPQRWVTGLQVEAPQDPGAPAREPFQPGADRVWAAYGDAVKFGQFPQADIAQFLAAQDSLRAEIARVSALPVHYLQPGGGTPPSGESLKTAEARLTKKAIDRQDAFGIVWVDLVSFGVRVATGQAGSPLEPLPLEVVWASAETRDDLLLAQTQVLKQQVGVSKQQSLREMGYTQEEIDRMSEEKQANAEEFGIAALNAFGQQPPGQSLAPEQEEQA